VRLAVLALVAACWTAAQNAPRPAAPESNGAGHSGVNTDARIKLLEEELRSAPGSRKLQTSLIHAYLQKMRETADGAYLVRASKMVDQMIARDGGDLETQRFQNEIDLQRHDFKAVSERARDMLKYASSDAGIWGNLGDALMELGEYEAAGQAYTRMFGLRPNLDSYNRLGYFRFVTGDAPAAIALMREAIAAGSAVPENTAWCWAEMGDMYFKTSQYDDAEKAYTSALELFPLLHRAEAGLGKVQAAERHVDAAIRHYKRAQSIVPLVEYAGALEDLYRKQGRAADAGEQMRLIDVIDNLGRAGKEKTNRALALILADHGRRLDHALELVEAETQTRGDVYTWDALSWVLFKLGRFQEARTASLKAVRLSTPEPSFYMHAAEIAQAVGEKVVAAEYRERLKTSRN
jgi:tetratricopeptide (TPR) repeat protein